MCPTQLGFCLLEVSLQLRNLLQNRLHMHARIVDLHQVGGLKDTTRVGVVTDLMIFRPHIHLHDLAPEELVQQASEHIKRLGSISVFNTSAHRASKPTVMDVLVQ